MQQESGNSLASNSMTIFQHLKSTTMNSKPADIIIKGQPFYRVENGYIPKTDYETIGIFEYVKLVNDTLEKGGKNAAIGDIRKYAERDYVKTEKGWRLVPKQIQSEN